jgi:hypothetical protein
MNDADMHGHSMTIERLQTENWQLRQACGYSIPAGKETPQNPFKCGMCDARQQEWEGTTIVYLRNVGTEDDECWVACANGDLGAVAFMRTSP